MLGAQASGPGGSADISAAGAPSSDGRWVLGAQTPGVGAQTSGIGAQVHNWVLAVQAFEAEASARSWILGDRASKVGFSAGN